uniref:Mannosyltransferase n=1 Tax=Plectus sambesii TaxID=2011161 RepID=A0A914V314_9BILA
MATTSIQNLNKPKDAFEQLEDEEGTRQGFCHIRIQQRTGRKTITTVQGVAPEYDLKKIVRYLKKVRLSSCHLSAQLRRLLSRREVLHMSMVSVARLILAIVKMWSEHRLLCVAVAFRLFNCLLVQTWFVPDEYFQAVEPAHRLAFGYGALTWEWRQGIRSYVYPLFIALYYGVLRLTALDSRAAVVHGPKLLQALFGALGDIHLFKLAKRFQGEQEALWSLLVYWSTWFGFFCTPRTLGNSVETVLTLIGLYHYPWPAHLLKEDERQTRRKHTWLYIAVAALAVLVRPTAVLFWAPLALWNLFRVRHPVAFVTRTCLPVALPVFALSVYVDRVCYGRWLLSAWNFAAFNVFEGGSGHFGVHPWHWYLSNGLPSVLTVHIIPIALGVYRSRNRVVLWLCVWYVLFHSVLAHKEHRFLLPIVPLLCLYGGSFVNRLASSQGGSKSDKQSHRRLLDSASLDAYWRLVSGRAKTALGLLLLVNVPIAAYTGLMHQRGPLDVTKFVSERYASLSLELRPDAAVWFLAPCHSTPFYSHVHANVSMRALNCDPNLDHIPGYVDEADRFHDHPERWLE